MILFYPFLLSRFNFFFYLLSEYPKKSPCEAQGVRELQVEGSWSKVYLYFNEGRRDRIVFSLASASPSHRC